MKFAKSSRGDPRLTGSGGRQAWPWIRNTFLFIGGAFLVYPGGIALGLMLGLPPDGTPFGLYIRIGMGANFLAGASMFLCRKKGHAWAFFSPVIILWVIELLGRI